MSDGEARACLSDAADNCILPPLFELHFARLGVVTVQDVLDNPDAYIEQRLADPHEGPEYGIGPAILYQGHKGLWIRSFAHGGINYSLEPETPVEDVFDEVDAEAQERIDGAEKAEAPRENAERVQSEEAAKTLANLKAKLCVVSASEYKGRRAPPMEWFAPNLIPAFNLTVLNGDGGVGKSLLGLQAQACSVAKRRWLGMELRHGPAIFVSGEDDADENHRRLERIAKAEGIDFDELADLHIVNLAGRNAALLAKGVDGSLGLSDLFRDLVCLVAHIQPASLLIDNAALTFGGNEIDRGEVAEFTTELNGLSRRGRCASVLLAHPSVTGMNSGTGTSGSTQWSNGARGRLWLRRPKEEAERKRDPNLRVIENMKQNYSGGVGDERLVRWEAGRFVEFSRAIISEVDVEAFLIRKIVAFAHRGDDLSPNSGARTGTIYAPLAISKDAEAREKGISEEMLRKALGDLRARGEVYSHEVKRASRNVKEVLRVKLAAIGPALGVPKAWENS